MEKLQTFPTLSRILKYAYKICTPRCILVGTPIFTCKQIFEMNTFLKRILTILPLVVAVISLMTSCKGKDENAGKDSTKTVAKTPMPRRHYIARPQQKIYLSYLGRFTAASRHQYVQARFSGARRKSYFFCSRLQYV